MKNLLEHIIGLKNLIARFLVVIVIFALLATSTSKSITTLNLRSTNNFVILAGTAITSVPPIVITGDVGLSPAAGTNITGFDGSNVTGILYVVAAGPPAGSVASAALLTAAKGDLTTAYNDAAGRTPVPTGPFLNPGSGNIGGLNLVPGLYKFTSTAAIVGNDVTLTGNPNDVWIFQIAASLNVGSGIHVILAGGAQAGNIFWQVGTSATLGSYSVFKGTILADIAITFGTGATIEGRALTFSGGITMASGVTLHIPAPTYQYIQLTSGWNMISSYITPANPSIITIFEQLGSDFLFAKDNIGNVYWPEWGIDDIGLWDITQGYQVYMSNPKTLVIIGENNDPTTTPIYLNQGWEMISYLRYSLMSPTIALSSIQGNFLYVKDNTGNLYWPEWGIDDIINMQPGQGYQIYMSQTSTLIYPGY